MRKDASIGDLRENLCCQPALRYVVFILSPQWNNEMAMLKERLETNGVVCMDLPVERNIFRLDGALEVPLCVAKRQDAPFIERNAARLDSADKLRILSGLLDGFFSGETDWKKDAVFLTDSPEIGRTLAQLGLVYFGCLEKAFASSIERNASHLDDAVEMPPRCAQRQDAPSIKRNASHLDDAVTWFEGAVLVLEGFADIDARYLEEWLLRAQGLPAVIARTERLLIREIAEEDIPELDRISRQDAQLALASEYEETEEEENSETPLRCAWDVFSKERLCAYIQTAYRLQGYGLWSVLYQGKVIGCCGFAPWDGGMEAPPRCAAANILYEVWDARVPQSEIRGISRRGQDASAVERNAVHLDDAEDGGMISLEMQYMLDTSYRRQGFGTEMCRAALEYSRTRLDVEAVWVRIREDNYVSQALAEKLGFHRYC